MIASLLLFAPQPQERVSTLTGNIQPPIQFESKILRNSRNVTVYLPPHYKSEPKRRFSVLYMHDGQNVFDGKTSYIPNQEWRADETAEALINAKLVEPLIIVGIDNGGAERGNEYLPTYDPKSKYGGKADLYTKMVMEEIKPMIDSTYRTLKDGAHTGVIGSSFGGIITLHMGLTHPETFGRIGIISPSLWWDSGVMLTRAENLKGKLPLKIWLDIGTEEAGPKTKNSEMTVRDTANLAKIFRQKGWVDGKDLAYIEEDHANHSEIPWARRFPSMLMFLFPAKY